MQKPLLLLCWAATIVSASSLKNVNDTIIESNAAATPLLSDSTETKLNKDNQSIHDPVEISNIDPTTESTSNLTTTVPTTTKPTTTTTKPTTTTTKPTTTTTKPTTTTTKPTTTTTNPTTTTSTPSTTVTPAPMPTMPPPPEAGKWKVQENNTVCILVQMAAQLNISYFNSDNKTVFKIVNIPSNGNVTGNCSKIDQYLMLSWHVQNKTAENNFTIHFIKNETEKYYSLHHFEISLTPEEFPNDKFNNSMTLVHMTPQFQTELSNSYRCIKEQKLNVTQKGKNITVGYLKVSKLLFQAFRSDNTTIFGLAKDCSFDTPDIVPITVGCALAGLVVIVLIAYLVGRRRNQAHGYFSM